MSRLSPVLAAYDTLLLDLDGCVRVGEAATPRADAAIAALRAAGKGIAFVTNDPELAPEEVVRQLWSLGVRASAREVVTVGGAVQHALAEGPHRTAFVVGPAAMWRHVELAGLRILNGTDLATRVDVVVVAAHGAFSYAELRDATRAVVRGAAILGAGRDATYPTPEGVSPGTGAVLAALEAATGARAACVGKPEPGIFRTALDRTGGSRALMVGDRIDADVTGAAAAGLDAAVVLSGVSSREDAEAARTAGLPVVAIGDTLADLVLAA